MMEGFMAHDRDTKTMAEIQGESQSVTVAMPEEMVETINEQLDYGDSRAGWIREAIRQRMEREGLFDE